MREAEQAIAGVNFCRGRRSTAPPSGLPAISPTSGEIGCRLGFRQSPTLQKKTLRAELLISPQGGQGNRIWRFWG
ncbi:hypothetical protein FJ420_33190 [Mesorhizobium sp. B3-1-3]|nr:hypothetical protein FJ424_33220 [Mesorhizobium sp. B3-1-8]TPI58109.1 hypothetical protein FJ420_33190 [Mesorhizobium sp. B3-1-3]